MTRSDHSATSASAGRTDTTAPSRSRHQPYPNAPARAASSRRGTAGTSSRKRPRASTMAPIPATVWACGRTLINPHTLWSTPILTKTVTSFSRPGDRVLVLPWPTATPRPLRPPAGTDESTDHAPTAELDDQLITALAVIGNLDRTAGVIHLESDPTACGPASRPFWADLLHTPEGPRPPETDPLLGSVPDLATTRPQLATATADLIITSLRPEHSGDRVSDHVALAAARLLRTGGTLVVLTHSDWTTGELVDPTGPVVASAQNADLLYLQHIIALHTPIHRGRFRTAAPTPARDRAAVGDWPAPHHRISSDVLVFAQPRARAPSAATHHHCRDRNPAMTPRRPDADIPLPERHTRG
jgi:hypothetical protein